MFNKDIFKRFEKKKRLYIGDFSEIYRVLDKNTKKEYALKMILKNNNKLGNINYLKNCIKRENEITKKCKCENIVEIYGLIETKDSYNLILELCDSDFETYLKDNPEKRNIYFIRNQIIGLNKALKILYEKKVMHRDIKPSNIFLKFKNDECIPKLGDFGISTLYEVDNNHSCGVGTSLFMAPEIIKGEQYNYKTDLYSLGVTLYYLIFDEYPYYGNPINIIAQITNKKPIKKTGLESLDDLLEQLLKEVPDERISFEDYFNHKFFKEKDNVLKNFKKKMKIIRV